ncbi:MAG TPA: zinc metallopeptidase [Pseudobacteroides sp.]|uniref:Peptidase membrane zinc metallopeptidase n=2 Tax=Eubacteriales TaxID=186802 RepID=A0A0L6JTN9_9FIRM|nr:MULTISPECIES: zinc metallopeptidase [Oscillospiraceae]KNY29094.1 peptidase membrane zinc metallopeptidase [Pseudobacteroides cellulosolvens ATCC 35603 = DSM 2933]MCX7842417.1 zinc metallopeptidase [Clostridia bacterium]
MLMDMYYIILVLSAFIFSLFAQFKVTSIFRKYSDMPNNRYMTGAQASRMLLDRHGLYDVGVEPVPGELTDHYDPRTKTVRLSESVYYSTSLAALGVAAHETGHAVQHAAGYMPLVLRSSLVPVANIGSAVGPYLAMFGLMLNMPYLLQLGIILFIGAVAFYLITLPVEFNASKRAIQMLKGEYVLNYAEVQPVKIVLGAAAMTYVASAAVAMANLIRLVLLAGSRDEEA